jgi:hypothetical protein
MAASKSCHGQVLLYSTSGNGSYSFDEIVLDSLTNIQELAEW